MKHEDLLEFVGNDDEIVEEPEEVENIIGFFDNN